MVKPHIQARYYYSQELGRFFYVLENYGLGPAIFQRVESEIGVLRPKINDDSVIWLVQQMVEGELGGYDDRDVRYDTVTKDCALPVGGTLNLFSFNCTEEEANRFRNTFLDTSKTTVHYKSAYGQKDCFLMTSDAYPYA
jgi:hypothetical protein